MLGLQFTWYSAPVQSYGMSEYTKYETIWRGLRKITPRGPPTSTNSYKCWCKESHMLSQPLMFTFIEVLCKGIKSSANLKLDNFCSIFPKYHCVNIDLVALFCFSLEIIVLTYAMVAVWCIETWMGKMWLLDCLEYIQSYWLLWYSSNVYADNEKKSAH